MDALTRKPKRPRCDWHFAAGIRCVLSQHGTEKAHRIEMHHTLADIIRSVSESISPGMSIAEVARLLSPREKAGAIIGSVLGAVSLSESKPLDVLRRLFTPKARQ